MITNFLQFINEGYAGSKQERFDRAIYLTYVDAHMDRDFKHVSKEEFYANLEDSLDKKTTVDYDKKNIHRIADKKEIWWSKNNKKLGEVYIEDKDESRFHPDEDGYVESYWIYLS